MDYWAPVSGNDLTISKNQAEYEAHLKAYLDEKGALHRDNYATLTQ